MICRAAKPKSRYAIRTSKNISGSRFPKKHSARVLATLAEARRRIRAWRSSQQLLTTKNCNHTIPPRRALSSSHFEEHDLNISEHRTRNLELYEYCQENIITRSRSISKKLRFAKSDFNVP